jgi:hypothetical protein
VRAMTRTSPVAWFAITILHVAAACRIDGYYLPVDSNPEVGVEFPIGDWVTRYGGLGDDLGSAVAVAPNGDLLLTGSFMDAITLGGPALTSGGGADVWVARYQADGTFIWSTRFGGIGEDRGRGIAVGGDGAVYVVGDFVAPVDFGGGIRSSNGGFLVKLAASTGTFVWDRVFEASGKVRAEATAILDARTIAVGGIFSGTASFGGGALVSTPSNSPDGFVAVYDIATGAHVWSKVLTTSGEDDWLGGLVAIEGDLVVAGAFKGTGMLGGSPLQAAGDYDLFLARYRGDDGRHTWSMRQGGTGAEFADAVATDGSHVFVGGGFTGIANLGGVNLSGTAAFRNAFLASYDSLNGGYVWSRAFSAYYTAYVSSLAATPTRLVSVITFEGDMIIGSQSFQNGGAAITRLNSSGDPRVAAHVENAGTGFGDTVSVAYAADRLVGAGTFHMKTRVFGVDLSSAGGSDITAFHVDF